RDQEGVAVIDGENGRPNSHFQSHGHRPRRRRPRSATSWFGPVRGAALGLLKEISRPPPPALGHLRNREQPFDFGAITRVDAKYISDAEIMIGSFHYRDLISSPHVTLGHYSEISPGSQRFREAARKQLIVHPNSKPPARYSRLGNLKNGRPDPPTLSD